VSRPSNTMSAWTDCNSASVTMNSVLNDHSFSPIPIIESRPEDKGKGIRLRTLDFPFVQPYKLPHPQSAQPTVIELCTRQRMKLTGSGILFAFNNSTCTVVGILSIFSHSPSLVPCPPPISLKAQPRSSCLVVIDDGWKCLLLLLGPR
jgi:hypothetical protein